MILTEERMTALAGGWEDSRAPKTELAQSSCSSVGEATPARPMVLNVEVETTASRATQPSRVSPSVPSSQKDKLLEKRAERQFIEDMRYINGVKGFLDIWLVVGWDPQTEACFSEPKTNPTLRSWVADLCVEAWVNNRHIAKTDPDQYDAPQMYGNHIAGFLEMERDSEVRLDVIVPHIIVTPPAHDNLWFETCWEVDGHLRPRTLGEVEDLEHGRLRVPWLRLSNAEIEPLWDYSLPDFHFEDFEDEEDVGFDESAPEDGDSGFTPVPGAQGWRSTTVPKSEGTRRSRARARRAANKQKEREQLAREEKAQGLSALVERCQAAFLASINRIDRSPAVPSHRPYKKVSVAPRKSQPITADEPSSLEPSAAEPSAVEPSSPEPSSPEPSSPEPAVVTSAPEPTPARKSQVDEWTIVHHKRGGKWRGYRPEIASEIDEAEAVAELSHDQSAAQAGPGPISSDNEWTVVCHSRSKRRGKG